MALMAESDSDIQMFHNEADSEIQRLIDFASRSFLAYKGSHQIVPRCTALGTFVASIVYLFATRNAYAQVATSLADNLRLINHTHDTSDPSFVCFCVIAFGMSFV